MPAEKLGVWKSTVNAGRFLEEAYVEYVLLVFNMIKAAVLLQTDLPYIYGCSMLNINVLLLDSHIIYG